MTDARSRRRGSVALHVTALALLAAAAPAVAAEAPDPLAAEIARLSAFVEGNPATGEIWTEVKAASGPVLDRAGEALRDGRRLLALQRLAAVRTDLLAAEYLLQRSEDERKKVASFEAEWTRMGGVLRDALGPVSASALDGAKPAAVRAEGEAALLQVRTFYDSSIEYGRATMPEAGLFYLGSAHAQRDFAAFCRGLPGGAPGRPPALRSIAPEIDALNGALLAAYRPPASIDKHPEFITASALLKEARELDAAGLRYGAMLRYLEAAMRSGPLRAAGLAGGDEAVAKRLDEEGERLLEPGVDHSLGRMFLEAAQANPGSLATAIASDVIPRYFTALAPAKPAPAPPPARVTVTLVRWPYT